MTNSLTSSRGHYVRCCFFFNHPATTEIYTLSLHDALPIYYIGQAVGASYGQASRGDGQTVRGFGSIGWGNIEDRKSTRLNSSHRCISYAVFCLKKKR